MEKPSVAQQLQVLREGEYVRDMTKPQRQIELTDAGHRWWEGIQALTPRAA
jgi:hypothetical protein